MSHSERYGTRDLTYSAWHRTKSLARFIGIEKAQTLALIDIDAAPFVEYHDGDKDPLILIETALDVGQFAKAATVTRRLAMRCYPMLPAYTVLYTPAQTANPADPTQRDIEQFRVKRLHPNTEAGWKIYTPQEFAEKLVSARLQSARLLDEYAEETLFRTKTSA
jgi:hypothetical protein